MDIKNGFICFAIGMKLIKYQPYVHFSLFNERNETLSFVYIVTADRVLFLAWQ